VTEDLHRFDADLAAQLGFFATKQMKMGLLRQE